MEGFEKPRVKSLLDHFSEVADDRAGWRVAHPLPEILLLVVCATIASCDDFEDIAAWGKTHLSFLRRFLPYHHGVPCARWLNILMNRINPNLFSDCFMAWAMRLRPSFPDQIALDGKTSRRSHDGSAGKAALHLVSAFATHEKLVLGQEATEEKSNEIMATVMAEAILVGWNGTIAFKGEKLAYSKENAAKLLSVQTFREWVAKQSRDEELYKVVKDKEDVENF